MHVRVTYILRHMHAQTRFKLWDTVYDVYMCAMSCTVYTKTKFEMAHYWCKLVCTSWSCQQAAGGQHPYARSYSDTQEGRCSFNAAAQCIYIQ